MSKLAGVIVALPAALPDGRQLDLDVPRRHIEVALAAGVDGFWVNGATGCSVYLNPAQRMQMLEGVCAAVAGRAPVLVMVSAVNLTEGVELARHAGALGIDGVSALTTKDFL